MLTENFKKYENHLIYRFLKTYNRNYENNSLAYLSIMQHYRHPTPLLDFSFNPFVALYFACIGNMDYKNLERGNIENYLSIYFISYEWFKENGNILKIHDFTPEYLDNERICLIENLDIINNNLNIISQEGLFLINTTSNIDVATLLQSSSDKKDRHFGCYNIHKSLAKYIQKKLNKMGYSKNSLFPNIENFK